MQSSLAVPSADLAHFYKIVPDRPSIIKSGGSENESFYRLVSGDKCGMGAQMAWKIFREKCGKNPSGKIRAEKSESENFIIIFYRFYILWSADWGRIVCAKPTAPVFMISHMDGLEAQISLIFRRFQRKERCFNCLRSIDSPAFLLWKLQKKGL